MPRFSTRCRSCCRRTCVGFVNGAGIALLGISPIVMTLAVNGILQGAALVYSNGTPDGFSSPLLRLFMTDQKFIATPVVVFVLLFVVVAVLLLGRTAFGRRIYAVGNGERVAALSGVSVGRTLIGVYMLSGLCSAIVGVMLTGFSGQASLGMGDDYLLPSIAVVVIGGTLITGGRGTISACWAGFCCSRRCKRFSRAPRFPTPRARSFTGSSCWPR